MIAQLETLYEDVNDIDIFIGGIAERPKAGSLLGHTFLCIVGDQFARLRVSVWLVDGGVGEGREKGAGPD